MGIFLDFQATTPLDSIVLEAMLPLDEGSVRAAAPGAAASPTRSPSKRGERGDSMLKWRQIGLVNSQAGQLEQPRNGPCFPSLAPKPPVAPGAARDLLSALRASDGFPVPHRQSLLAVGTRRLRVLAIGVVGAAVESAATLTRPRHETPPSCIRGSADRPHSASRRCRSGHPLAGVPRRKPSVVLPPPAGTSAAWRASGRR